MNNISKSFIFIGFFFIIVGLIWHFFKGQIPFGKLPGDIHIKTKNSNIYFPIMTCIVISIVLTVIGNFLRK